MDMDSFNTSQYSPKWQFRFNFFEKHGAPNAPGFKEALQTLPFGEKVKVNFNFFALFFTWIYLFILGLWRKAIVVLAVTVALYVVAMILPGFIGRTLLVVWSLLVAITTNYAYYLDRVKGNTSWNPFEGLRW